MWIMQATNAVSRLLLVESHRVWGVGVVALGGLDGHPKREARNSGAACLPSVRTRLPSSPAADRLSVPLLCSLTCLLVLPSMYIHPPMMMICGLCRQPDAHPLAPETKARVGKPVGALGLWVGDHLSTPMDLQERSAATFGNISSISWETPPTVCVCTTLAERFWHNGDDGLSLLSFVALTVEVNQMRCNARTGQKRKKQASMR